MAKRKSKSNVAPEDGTEVPFEAAFEELQDIVSQLEQGQLSLGDSLEKYELGIRHLGRCFEALNAAEKKIEMLVKLDENGNMVTKPFETAEATRDRKSKSKKSSREKADDVEQSVDDSEGLF